MDFIIGVLTVVLALDSLFLILLILVQLPKKEAGIGTAFGGAATDALFGAGKGNALTNLTKWSAGIFLGLSLFLSIVTASRAPGNSAVKSALKDQVTAGTNSVSAPASSTSQKPSLAMTNLLETPAASNVLKTASTNISASTTVSTNVPTVLKTNVPALISPSSTNK